MWIQPSAVIDQDHPAARGRDCCNRRTRESSGRQPPRVGVTEPEAGPVLADEPVPAAAGVTANVEIGGVAELRRPGTEPKNCASPNAKTPPSESKIQYPHPVGVEATPMALIAGASVRTPGTEPKSGAWPPQKMPPTSSATHQPVERYGAIPITGRVAGTSPLGPSNPSTLPRSVSAHHAGESQASAMPTHVDSRMRALGGTAPTRSRSPWSVSIMMPVAYCSSGRRRPDVPSIAGETIGHQWAPL